MDIDEIDSYPYTLRCSLPGCGRPAVYKVASRWSDGTSRELKNYGLACEAHREAGLTRAREARERLHLAEGEAVGPVVLFALKAGRRDAELAPLSDPQGPA